MILAIDVGNSQIFCGVFIGKELKFSFRRSSRDQMSSDEVGIFLRQVLRENELDPRQVKDIVIASVVPDLNHSIVSGCIKYFDIRPLLVEPSSKTGLVLKAAGCKDLGADRIANVS